VLAQRALCLAARAVGDTRKMRRCTKALEELDTADSASSMWLERGRVIVAQVAKSSEPDQVQLDEGAYAAKRAAKIRGGWIEPTFLLAQIAVQRNDMEALGSAVDELNEEAPDDVRTAKYDTIAALASGDIDRARSSLARAEGLGLDESTRAALQLQIDDAEPWSGKWLPILASVIAVSAGGMALYARRRRLLAGGRG
jgi:hypothetical protein